MAKHGKKYREALEKIDRDQLYSPVEALTLTKETSYAKFDETIVIQSPDTDAFVIAISQAHTIKARVL